MGILHYAQHRFEFDDRLLAHLQVVLTTKLRRNESFFLSWTTAAGLGSGRHAVWVSPSAAIHIEYHGNRPASINREWVEALTAAANTTRGLVLTDEGEPAGS